MAGTGSTAYIVYIVERNTELENIKQGAPLHLREVSLSLSHCRKRLAL